MIRKVEYNGTVIEYNLQYRNVKNINLRIKPNLSVNVSANKRVSLKYADEFVIRKGRFILSALEKFKQQSCTPLSPKYSEEEFVEYVSSTFEEVYELFKREKIKKPVLRLKNVKSRWGSCNSEKGIIMLSTNLIYCTKEQIYYVIVHEFSHLLIQNHSADFYKTVEKYCADYKRINKEMNKIILR